MITKKKWKGESGNWEFYRVKSLTFTCKKENYNSDESSLIISAEWRTAGRRWDTWRTYVQGTRFGIDRDKGSKATGLCPWSSSFRGGIAVATGTGTRCQWPSQWREWRHYANGKLGQRHSVGKRGSEGSDNPTWSPRRKLHLFRGNRARFMWSMDLLVKRSDSSILRGGLIEYLIILFLPKIAIEDFWKLWWGIKIQNGEILWDIIIQVD